MQSYTSQRHNLEFTHFINSIDDLGLAWGISAQQDRVNSDHYFRTTGRAKRNTYRIYGNAVVDFDSKNTVDMGVLVEKSDGTDADLSPRIAYLHHINDRHTVRIGASQAIRTPFLFEQDANIAFTGTATIGGVVPVSLHDQLYFPLNVLKTEKITSIEFGYYGKFAANRMLFNTRIFQDKLEDLIDAPEVADPTGLDNIPDFVAFVFDNLHATTVRGIEAEIDFRIDRTSRIVASGAILNIISDDPVRDGKSREYEESAPDHSFSLLAIKDFNNKYSGSVGFYYVGDMAWMDANHNNTCEGGGAPNGGCGFRNTQGYRKLDLRLVRNFRLGGEHASIALNLQNLLDEYSDYDKFPSSLAPAVEQNLIAFIQFKLQIH